MASSHLSDFGDLLLRLYRLSKEQPLHLFQDQALGLVKGVVSFESAMWGTAATAPPGGIDVHTLHLHEKSPQMMIDYEDVKHLDTAAASLFGLARGTRAFNTATWWGDRRGWQFRDYVQGYEQNNMLITMANDTSAQFMEWISLFRADPEQHNTEAETRLVHLLSPHLMQALGLNRVTQLERSAPDWRPKRRGTAMGDLMGVLYHVDPIFEALMRSEWNDWPGRVLPRAVLEHFLRGQGHFVGRTLVATHHVEHGLLFLRARPRYGVDGLSPRERVVAQLLAKGNTHKQIAQQLGRSPATVRNQIRSIYEKLGVTHVAGLLNELRLAQ
ncbi:helix-turn-helix transcriptional regulator [Variovorax saccharolyticus]|nr:helix-turn-helix transcriptional regulator [Variovorax sp. J22R187]MDM0022873.1 helix-turn-helix transcriptional regulator [Variovorax sp. J22R187]